jgi:hypothetical protein
MTFDPPLPSTIPAHVAESISQRLDLGKWLVLGFSRNQKLTYYLEYATERERNAVAASINLTPGASVRMFNPPTASERA